MTNGLIFLMIIALTSSLSARSEAKTKELRILTENWPPISYEENGKAQGMVVELVQAIQKDLGSESPIEVVPWARGYHFLQNTPNTLLFTLVRTPEREKLFTLLGPVAYGDTSLFATTKSRVKFHNLEQMKSQATVAVTRGTSFENALKEKKFKNILDVRDSELGIKLLLAGRVDFLCDDSLSVANVQRRLKIQPNSIHRVTVFDKYNLYLSFSKGTQPETLISWKKSLKNLSQNGQFAQIYRKWFNNLKAPTNIELIGLLPPTLKHQDGSEQKSLLVERAKTSLRTAQ